MKNRWIVGLILCLILVGSCTNIKVNKQEVTYKNLINKLINNQNFEKSTNDFSIITLVNKLNNDFRYDLIIKEPQIEMYNLKVLAILKDEKDASFPSLGILENDTFHLVPNKIDKSKGYYEGVNLSGISKKENVKLLVYISYTSKETELIERYFILDGNATR